MRRTPRPCDFNTAKRRLRVSSPERLERFNPIRPPCIFRRAIGTIRGARFPIAPTRTGPPTSRSTSLAEVLVVNIRTRSLVFAAQAVLALGVLLNLGACSQSAHPTDPLAVAGRRAGAFQGGVNLPVPASLSLSPQTVAGGATSTGTVQLSDPAPAGGAAVALSSSSTAATVPASVTVAGGASSARFTVTTTPVAANTSASIRASLNGNSRSATLTITSGGVVAGVSLASIALSPTTVAALGTSVGTVTLSAAAPAAGAAVAL